MIKPSEFKKLIKEAVREAIQEELKEILLEAIKSPKTIVKENITEVSSHSITPPMKRTPDKNIINDIVSGMKTGAHFTTDNIPKYNPPPVNTSSEGSRLPDGEISLDQITGLMNLR